MKIAELPRAESKIDVGYLSSLGIKSYDSDNLYPQNVLRIVGASKVGGGCLERYVEFLEGDGIADKALEELVVNRQGETLGDIHSLISSDFATFDGFALHVNYNADFKIISIHHVPFENVRLCESDDEGVIKQVAVHPDWSGCETRAGKPIRVTRDNIDYINVFDPSPEVVSAQIADAGGISYYKGQVLYFSNAGHLRYPLAMFDEVLTDMSTDEGCSNLMLRNARNNFIPAGFFVHFKGQGAPGMDEDDYGADDPIEYADELRRLQGDTNALKIMEIEVETKEEIPEFVSLDGKNIDKDFTNTIEEVRQAIYAKFNQEAFYAVLKGKVGFSGALMAEASDDYARKMVKRQKKMTRAYVRLLERWADVLPVEPNRDALDIVPYTYAVNTIEKINE